MPVKTIWTSKTYGIAEYSGAVAFEEVRDHLLALPSDPRWENLRHSLSDWTRVERVEINEEQLKILAVHLAVYAKTLMKLRVALVLGDFEHAVENAQIFMAFMSEYNIDISVQPTIADAERWLFHET